MHHQFWDLIQGGGEQPASIFNDEVWRDMDHLMQNVPQDDVLAFIPDTDADQYGSAFLLARVEKWLDRGAGSFAVHAMVNEDGSRDTTTWYIRGGAGDANVVGYARLDDAGEVRADSPLVVATDYPIERLLPRYPALYGTEVARLAGRIVRDHLEWLAERGESPQDS